jgi:hypothetical protein
MIVEIKMIFIGTTKISPKNRSELVFFGCVDRKRPVLGGPVRSPQYLGRSWTGCGPRLRVLGAKNRTEPDLKTLMVVVVVEEDIVCLLMTPKLSIGILQCSIWTSLGTLHIPQIPFQCNSIKGNSCIPAEFEFHSKFCWNFFINLAGPSAKIDSSGILGIAQILPDSGQNQWRTIKTSMYGMGRIHCGQQHNKRYMGLC